jgi:hypothetical protein
MVLPEESVRAGLIKTADLYFWWLVGSTIVLLVGAVGEYFNPFEWLRKNNLKVGRSVRPSHRWVRSIFISEQLAIWMVIGGIAGEGVFEYLGARAESAVREFDSNMSIAARKEATDGLNTASQRLTGAKHDIDAARLALRAQGPRWALLREAAPELSKRLAPFARQRTDLLICGPRSSTDLETQVTWATLASVILGEQGANWNLERPDPSWSACTPPAGYMVVYVNSEASQRTRQAANTLIDGLRKALFISQQTTLVEPTLAVVNPKVWLVPFLIQTVDKENPMMRVAANPDLVAVLIGSHP